MAQGPGPGGPGPMGRLFDQVHIVTLDQPDVALPLVTEPIPGFDQVVIVAGEIIRPIQHERGSDPFASTRRRATGGFQAVGHLDDLDDFPGQVLFLIFHDVFSCCAWLPFPVSIARRWVKAA
jgi:hypothetical protein